MEAQNKTLYNINELIQFRRQMHSLPELQFEEIETQKKIKEFLISKGLQEKQFVQCAKTGWVIDIFGRAPEKGEKKLIAFRADIDALSFQENNPDIEYRSTNNAAHACGHDGHTATLLGLACLFLEKIDVIPKNKGIRLLFQPSEEGPISGAKVMIQEGCMQGVDEVYGHHNFPSHPVGYLLNKVGAMMSGVSIIKIKLIGKGGHGSEPKLAIDPTQMAVDFHIKYRKMQQELEGRLMRTTIPVLKCGDRFNVIADFAHLEGTLRSQENDIPDLFEQKLIQILEELKIEYPGSNYELNFMKNVYDMVDNHEKQTEIVNQLGRQHFGTDKVGHFDTVPIYASEDFSFFLREKPGCFFFLGSGRKFNDTMIHHSTYNYNDDLLEPASQFFYKIAENRLELA
ncbi:Peptidase M20, dimerization domain [Pseudocohnilembus persalinus]|uniref:Peptidase M20, dimerization domain n=1 Tax=Pseudocohnilembus persalinus TaxID=266149 RepID=A0A0V0R2L8_PSEPJ|nr:Peptidase M20, dimerization domain [Pseudocohnilembus persalinus]|eukprot:KRX08782.1 Peptidase M20, dimerization domain [Pseudocohnilembus persalinus]